MLITTAHQRCLTSLAVSDKRIPEWLSVIGSPQNWGLVCWEATSGVKSGVLCRSSSCSCARVMRWKANVASSLTDVWHQLFEQPDITLKKIVFRVPKITRTTRTLCEIKGVMWEYSYEGEKTCTTHFHPCLHENHTSAPAPGDTNWNRHAWTCLSETSEGRQWAEAASDWNVVSNQQSFTDQATDQWNNGKIVLMRVSKSKANTCSE